MKQYLFGLILVVSASSPAFAAQGDEVNAGDLASSICRNDNRAEECQAFASGKQFDPRILAEISKLAPTGDEPYNFLSAAANNLNMSQEQIGTCFAIKAANEIRNCLRNSGYKADQSKN